MAGKKTAKNDQTLQEEYAFFDLLRSWYEGNKNIVRREYTSVTKRILDHNDPAKNATTFLRQPQFEALETYVFLKEFLGNRSVAEIFEDWMEKQGVFAGRDVAGTKGSLPLFDPITRKQYDTIMRQLLANERSYANYIFALTMGTGKTILMATCIFYEFYMAKTYPADPRFCHNALVFAPDKTVLQSLREIESFDRSRVMPANYANWLNANLRFHYLEESGVTLDVIDNSKYNIVVSNTQKIILKRQHKEKNAAQQLFGAGRATLEEDSAWAAIADLLDMPQDDKDLATNQRFQKLQRLSQLGIYVDEAHHAFGKNLAKDLGQVKDTRKTSLRNTIDILAASLTQNNTHVVGCFNFTGTPYVGQQVLPEVVYAYGLKQAIDAGYLKQARLSSFTNPRSQEFVDLVIDDFLAKHDLDEIHEGLRPKLAFFAATIDELQKELRPALESALARHDIPVSKILVNVGDPKLTTNDDIREFNRLDTARSEKQFILLVNKGREGWNCRSLFGVALFRKPKSKIFVLQATMRCLRAIGDVQNQGSIYLSQENLDILDAELQQNFRVTSTELGDAGNSGKKLRVRVIEPPPKITLKRIRKMFRTNDKKMVAGKSLQLDEANTDQYQLVRTVREGLREGTDLEYSVDVTDQREQVEYSEITLSAEIARYLNKSPIFIERTLESTAEGLDKILEAVNQHNELVHDWIIPRLFDELFEVTNFEANEEYEIELVKRPEQGYYELKEKEGLTAKLQGAGPDGVKSFHLDHYIFDSNPEQDFFWKMLRSQRVQKIYFTGMLTHGQSEFFIQYIDPDTHSIRSYYPDFLVQDEDGSYIIYEVKGDHQIDDRVVRAKQSFANSMAAASGMTYKMIRSSRVSQLDQAGLWAD